MSLAGSVGVAGCGSETATIEVEVTTGLETDAMSRAPAVTRVDVTATAVEGDVNVTASAAPGEAFDLGELPSERLYGFEVSGVDATGAVVLRGRSLAVHLGGLASGAVLPIFAQRVDAWARPGGGLVRAHVGAPAVAVAERFLLSTGGTEAHTAEAADDVAGSDFYDLLALAAAVSEPAPEVARSLVGRGAAVLHLGDGGATWIDFDAGTVSQASLPEGLASFAEVAGGRAIDAPDGVTFVVGATRADAPSRAVLEIAADGSLAARSLARSRQGAAAAWVEGSGLVVAGGSGEEPGAELLAPGATAFASLPYPADPVTGAAAVGLSEATLTLLGGALGADEAPARTLPLGCAAACAAAPLALPLPDLRRDGIAYRLGDGRAIAVGTDATPDALVRVFLVDPTSLAATELPLREPRRGATPVPAPNGTLAMMGGLHPDGTAALEVELWFPPSP